MKDLCKVDFQELKYAFEKIEYWYKKNIKFLNIITVPFNTSCVFLNIINKVSEEKGKILYVYGKKGENRELINILKENHIDITHSYIEEGKSTAQITFVHYNNLHGITQNYDLIIFDDITYFSNLTIMNLRNILDECVKLGDRVVLYSIEKTTLVGEKFELAVHDYKKPFVEPRILTTRVDLNEDIPFLLYDYIKWFKENENKIAIFVPSRDKVNKVYDYFLNKLKITDVKLIKAYKIDEIRKYEKVLKYKNKAIFIITNKIEELLEYCHVDNAVILFSDDERYTYKKILYTCGKMRNRNLKLPEVILVSNDVSIDMEKAKNMAREFNKKVWEKHLREL